MPYTTVFTALLALIWSQVVYSNSDHHHKARIKINSEEVFKRYNMAQNDSMWKLVKDPGSSDIYAGGHHGLFKLEQNEIKQKRNSSISLLTEGKNGTLLTCEKKEKEDSIRCYFLYLSNSSDSGYLSISQAVQINEPSLLVDNALFFTMSGQSTGGANLGLYKLSKDINTWPQSTSVEHTYIKIITNNDQTSLDGKLYSFQAVKNTNQDPETPLWISQVSQYCMNDRGGSKSKLQLRWTSMLTARLFCGNKEKRLTYTQLLDVAELETSNGTMIYALFKNVDDIRAVCVYNMSEITRIFASSKFKIPPNTIESLPKPGECVQDSRSLNSLILKFMEQRPEMEDWIESEPLLTSHHFYSHLQVDRVNHRNVLLLTLENGKIHKVLEKKDGHLIIAEYQPFQNKNRINSMLLDRDNKKLYVSYSSQVVEIDLQNCSLYGDTCQACVMARDPYCSWSGSQCSPATVDSAERVRIGDFSVCESPRFKRLSSVSYIQPYLIIPQDSKYYLTCPTLSKHASYAWIHENNTIECVSTDEECLLLIESMSKKDEGLYECMATENEQTWTVSSSRLVENGVSHLTAAPAVVMWLLILICVTF